MTSEVHVLRRTFSMAARASVAAARKRYRLPVGRAVAPPDLNLAQARHDRKVEDDARRDE